MYSSYSQLDSPCALWLRQFIRNPQPATRNPQPATRNPTILSVRSSVPPPSQPRPANEVAITFNTTMSLRINIPSLTRILLILLVGLSLTYQSIRWRLPTNRDPLPYLTIIPQLSIYYPWVFLTSPLAEQNIVSLLIAGATVLYGGKYLERAWGSREFGKFWLVVTLIPNIIAVIIYLIWFAIKQRHYTVYAAYPAFRDCSCEF